MAAHETVMASIPHAMSCAAIYSLMFASGYWIYGRTAAASALTAIALVAGLAIFPILKHLNSNS